MKSGALVSVCMLSTIMAASIEAKTRSGGALARHAIYANISRSPVLQPSHPQVADAEKTASSSDWTLDEIPLFLLNLDKRQDRLAGFSNMMGTRAPWMCPHICRVSAPDAGSFAGVPPSSFVPSSIWQEAASRDTEGEAPWGRLSKGAVGCILGHAKVWEQFLQTGHPWGIVFEDDAVIYPGASKTIGEIIAMSSNTHRNITWNFILLNGPASSENFHLGLNPSTLPGHHFGTGAYAISREGARNLLKAAFPIDQDRQLDSPTSFLWSQPLTFVGSPGIAGQWGWWKGRSDVQVNLEKQIPAWHCPVSNCPGLDQSKMVMPGLAVALNSAGTFLESRSHSHLRASRLQAST